MSYIFDIGQVYNFSLVGNTLQLPVEYKQLKCVGYVDYSRAASEIDIAAYHHSIYPSLVDVPDDPTSYHYVIMEDTLKNKHYFGVPWVQKDTIELNETATMSITIRNISHGEVSKIMGMLYRNGYREASYSVTSTSTKDH